MTDKPVGRPCRIRDIVDLPLDGPIEVFDIGAMLEGEARYDVLVEQELARVTGFEPNLQELDRLKANERPGCTWLPHVLGDGNPAIFHQTRYSGCSSLLEPDPALIDLFVAMGATTEGGNFTVVDRRRVETARLDDITDCPAADYVKIDVQGAELDVLSHGQRKLSGVVVIEAEVEFVPLYRNQPLFADIDAFLRTQGFLLHKFIDVRGRNFRPVTSDNTLAATSQVLSADAVFVRDVRKIGALSPRQLLKGAVVLHDVYRSYDLSHLFLYVHDLRTGTSLAAPYLEVIQSAGSIPRLYMNLRERP